MTLAYTPTGPADVRDQRWLDERIETARNGIEAVIDIALNWTEGRQVGRLHPGVAPADYVREHVGLLGRDAIVPLLTESNWSQRQIAQIAGVTPGAVRYHDRQLRNNSPVERPDRTLGSDGKWRASTRPRLDPAPDPYFQAKEPDPMPAAAPVREDVDAAWRRAELDAAMAAIEALTHPRAAYAEAVFAKRRGTTAKRLRDLGVVLGGIAVELERMKETPE